MNVKDNHVTICSLIRKKNINPKIIPLQRPFKSLPFETICKCYENALRDTFSIMMTLTDIIILFLIGHSLIKLKISSKMSYSTSISSPFHQSSTIVSPTKMKKEPRKLQPSAICDTLNRTTIRFVISSLFVFLFICHSSDATADDTLYLYDDDLYDTNYYYEDDYNSALTKYYKENPRTVGQHGSG